MNDERLIEELSEASAGLTFMSESDYPVEALRWQGVREVTPEYLRGLTNEDPSAPVEMINPEDFFRVSVSEPAWKTEADVATARKFQALLRLLEDRLEGLTVYRVGEINMPVYVVGRSPAGDWLGVSTRVVET
jgi:hypothetical protein